MFTVYMMPPSERVQDGREQLQPARITTAKRAPRTIGVSGLWTSCPYQSRFHHGIRRGHRLCVSLAPFFLSLSRRLFLLSFQKRAVVAVLSYMGSGIRN